MAHRHARPQLPLQAHAARHSGLRAVEGGQRGARSLARLRWR